MTDTNTRDYREGKRVMPYRTNVSASLRPNDNAVLISTDAYVSHKKQSGPWRSTFSLALQDARQLHSDLTAILEQAREN